MDEAVRNALNDQIQRELYAAYLYLSMVTYFEDESLPGFAHFMRMQSDEELGHAKRIIEHLHERGERVELQAIQQPPAHFDSPVEVMRQALEHEREVTGHINDIYDLALEKGDHPTKGLMQWFVEEQVEEEAWAGQIVDQLERIGDEGASLLVLDARLAEREPEG